MTALALCGVANATNLKILTLGEGTVGIDYPAIMGFGISPDGKYVCGSLEYGVGYFVINVDTNEYAWAMSDDPEGAELRNVDNNGLAIGYNGPGVTYSIDEVETELPTPDSTYKYVLGEDLTLNGSLMVGSLVGSGYVSYPAYSKDGEEWTLLPLPSDEEMGYYQGKGGAAKCVSSDGKVIAGYIGSYGPAVIWRMNDAGEYEIDPIYSDYITVSADEEKEFLQFSVAGLSDNGKYVLISAADRADDGRGRLVPIIYDTTTGELTEYLEPQDIDTYQLGLTPIAIADNGTFVGVVGRVMETTGTFIMRAGETQAEMFVDAFPEYAETFSLLDLVGCHTPTGMSADGRYILGYGYYSENPYDDDGYYYFMTYVLDTTGGSGVECVNEAVSDAVATDYFTIDGRRISAPQKGINIVRMSDGSIRKVMK